MKDLSALLGAIKGKTLLILLTSIALQFPFATSSFATTALTFPSAPTNSWTWGAATIGWQFTTSADLNIDSLGVWDQDGDGLTDSHDIGIWTLGGTLLTSGTVSSGSGNLLEDGFRWVNIPSYSLPAGTYVVGAYMPTSADEGAALASYTTASEVTYVQNLFLYGSGFTLPTEYWDGYDGGNFGANFKYNSNPVVTVPNAIPTLSQWGMIILSSLLAMGTILTLRRKRL